MPDTRKMRRRVKKPEDQLDDLAREICRSREVCENPNCRRRWGLQWAHIFSRGYKQVRWSLENCFCLCSGCHRFYTDRPIEWEDFVKRMIGEENYYKLRQRAQQYGDFIDYGKIAYDLQQRKKTGHNENQYILPEIQEGRYAWKKKH